MAEIIPYGEKYAKPVKAFILGILEDEFGIRGEKRPDLDDISCTYQRNKSNFWVAVDRGKVVGTIALMDYGSKRGYLKRMYVARELRGSGLAAELLNTLIEFARKNGMRGLYCGTVGKLAAANKFYQKHGFLKIEKLPGDMPEFGDDVFYLLGLQ
ncbi:Acetyltransferase (GNAT) family protein [uncultured archaeon]|nr:Acetyltransferase (GNAT) family protein [uncultured archaeon]